MSRPDFRQIAYDAAVRAGHPDPDQFVRQIGAESNFDPNAGSPAGAIGIAQITPGTAKGWGVNPRDPVASLNAAAKAMSKYITSYKGDYAKALAAYNAGVGAVAKYGGVPPYAETRSYVNKILGGTNPPARPRGRAGSHTGPSAGTSVSAQQDPKTQALEFIMKGSPFEGMATARYKPLVQTTPPPTSGAPPSGQRDPIGKDYRWIQQQGMRLFGLRNDPGDGQLTGGGHSVGSEHYDRRAVDFGTARNSKEQLRKWLAWAKTQGLDAIDEGDHVHVSLPGSGI